jgi:hypothetical protein
LQYNSAFSLYSFSRINEADIHSNEMKESICCEIKLSEKKKKKSVVRVFWAVQEQIREGKRGKDNGSTAT